MEKHQLIDIEDQSQSSPTTRSSKLPRVLAVLVLLITVSHISDLSSRPQEIWRHACRKASKPPIRWTSCLEQPDYQCGTLTVPKDYFNGSAGHAKIAMLKVPAKVHSSHPDYLGSIFLNPGGPGGSGRDLALRFGKNLSALTKGRYDYIGFDPRGIGASKPLTACFASTLEYELFKSGSILERGFDIPRDPFSPEGKQHLLDQHRQLLAMQETEFEKCRETMGEELRYMGTSTVVRDIEEMSRVLHGKDAKINYHGWSYGTVLGAFLVNMIPDKIGRVVIDGVASAPQWANQHTYDWLHDWMVNTEDAYQWFLRDCFAAGPDHCPLVKSTDKSAGEIEQRVNDFLDHLYDEPMAVPHAVRPGVLNSGGARALLYRSTNSPSSWPRVASNFAQAIAGDATALYDSLVAPLHLEGHGRSQIDLSRAAVSCADTPPFESEDEWPTAEFMVEKTLRVLKDTSRNFGASVTLIEPDGGCQFWPASGRTPERFTGPWNATLETPMLIISNTADPITPLASGREINHLMSPSSRLLIQNSPGHCSLSSVSVCTAKYWRDYFLEGTLPIDETLCEVDQGYFPTAAFGVEGAQGLKSNESEEIKELRDIVGDLVRGWGVWLDEV